MSFQIKTVSILKIEITLISKEAFSSFFQILFHQDENDNNGLTRAAISSSGEVLVKKNYLWKANASLSTDIWKYFEIK